MVGCAPAVAAAVRAVLRPVGLAESIVVATCCRLAFAVDAEESTLAGAVFGAGRTVLALGCLTSTVATGSRFYAGTTLTHLFGGAGAILHTRRAVFSLGGIAYAVGTRVGFGDAGLTCRVADLCRTACAITRAGRTVLAFVGFTGAVPAGVGLFFAGGGSDITNPRCTGAVFGAAYAVLTKLTVVVPTLSLGAGVAGRTFATSSTAIFDEGAFGPTTVQPVNVFADTGFAGLWGTNRDLASTGLNIAFVVQRTAVIVGTFLKANVGLAVLAFRAFCVDKTTTSARAALTQRCQEKKT